LLVSYYQVVLPGEPLKKAVGNNFDDAEVTPLDCEWERDQIRSKLQAALAAGTSPSQGKA